MENKIKDTLRGKSLVSVEWDKENHIPFKITWRKCPTLFPIYISAYQWSVCKIGTLPVQLSLHVIAGCCRRLNLILILKFNLIFLIKILQYFYSIILYIYMIFKYYDFMKIFFSILLLKYYSILLLKCHNILMFLQYFGIKILLYFDQVLRQCY